MQRQHTDTTKSYNCETCGNKFSSMHKFRRHLIRHVKPQPDIKCDECDRMFYMESEMKNHKNKIHDKKLFQCQYCGKIFQVKLNMEEHIRTVHLKEDLKLLCEFCDKTYPNKRSHIKHQKVMHKNYPCPDCNETIRGYNNFVQHKILIHTKLLFRCMLPGCEKGFTHNAKLARHLRKFHKDLSPEERERCENIRKTMKPT